MYSAVAEAVTETAKDFLDSTICETLSRHLLDARDARAGVRVHACVLTLNHRCDDILDLRILSATVLTKKVFIRFSTNASVHFTAYVIHRLETVLCKPKEMIYTLHQNVLLQSGDSAARERSPKQLQSSV